MTTVLVVDAGVIVEALAGIGEQGGRARDRLLGHDLHAPHLIDVEVVSAMRRQVRHANLTHDLAEDVLTDLAEMPLTRHPHLPVIPLM